MAAVGRRATYRARWEALLPLGMELEICWKSLEDALEGELRLYIIQNGW